MVHTRRRAFTLLELLIVIGIIAILSAVTFAVGRAVTTNSKRQITLDTIRVLEGALAAYSSATGDIPPGWVADPRPTAAGVYIPVADARNMTDTVAVGAAGITPLLYEGDLRRGGNQMINSAGLFVLQCQSVPDAKAMIDRIPARYMIQATSYVNGANLTLPTVLDGFGRPIRYVHPAWAASFAATDPRTLLSLPRDINGNPYNSAIGNIRRTWKPAGVHNPADPQAANFADSDGGRLQGARPYFYSAGDDGYLGRDTNKTDLDRDNLYTTVPVRPRE